MEVDDVVSLLRQAQDVRKQVVQRRMAEDSAATWDLEQVEKAVGSRKPVERIIVMADLWTYVAADQIAAMATLAESRVHVFPFFPLARSVIEHSGMTLWVLDNRVGPRARAVRAALAHLRSQEEMAKVASRWAGRDSAEKRHQKQGLQDLRDQIEEEFGSLDVGQGTTLDGQRLPRPTHVVEDFGEREGQPRAWVGIYDYLCATATHPGLSAFEFFDTEAERPPAMMPLDFLARLARACLTAYVAALKALTGYAGWSVQPVNDLVADMETTLSAG